MSVKTTVFMTRKQAIERYVQLKLVMKEKKLRYRAAQLNNKSLEEVLEQINDYNNNGEGFENYVIGVRDD